MLIPANALIDAPDSALGKFSQAAVAVLLFVAVVSLILFIASRFSGHRGDRATAFAFLGPTVLLVSVGLIYPGLRTIFVSLKAKEAPRVAARHLLFVLSLAAATTPYGIDAV